MFSYLEYYYYYLYYTFVGYPFIIRFAISAIGIYMPFFGLAIFVLFRTRNRYYKKIRIKRRLSEKYGQQIQDLMTSEKTYSEDEIGNTLSGGLKKTRRLEKRILSNIILSIRNKSFRVNVNNYRNLLEYLGLRQFWERRLKYGTLASRQRAIRKLDDMDMEIPGSVITFLTYDRNKNLRKRARASYLYFSNTNPYKFFSEDFDRTFNHWDMVEIHRMLTRRENEKLPSLSQWLKNSKSVPFRCFLIDEIGYFDQRECGQYLLELVTDSEDMEIRRHCINTLGVLDYREAEEVLKKNYVLEPRDIQECIVKAIGKFNTGRSLEFLEQAWHDAIDVESRKITLNTIYNYGDAGRELFHTMKCDALGFSLSLFDHVANPLIKYI